MEGPEDLARMKMEQAESITTEVKRKNKNYVEAVFLADNKLLSFFEYTYVCIKSNSKRLDIVSY